MRQGQHVIGREPELAAVHRFLAEPGDGPWALSIEGEAGIGKTTLWEAGLDVAQRLGYRVLIARIGESETKLSFTALGDLLEPVVDEALPELPEPQRAALVVALLRAEATGPASEQRAISLACLGVLRTIARSSPVLLALDDLQWVDGSSARVLAFVLRRFRDEPIRLLASVRLGTSGHAGPVLDRTLPASRMRAVFVGPMSPGAVGNLIRDRIGADLPHPILHRLHHLAGGNPFFALEIAKELVRWGIPAAGETLPVPDDLRELLRLRLESLPKATRASLLVVAATSRPTETLLGSVFGPDSDAALAKAERAGVVRIDGGRISFTHPLLASTVYEAASGGERRRTHRRLTNHVEDPEERARHLALAAEGPDPDVASALDEASRLARARGAPDAAAELSELARKLTPEGDNDALRRRTVKAAEHHFDAGDDARARALFDEAIGRERPGRERARLLYRLSAISWMDMRRVYELCRRALKEAGHDPELLAVIHEHLVWVGIYRGDLAGASENAIESMDSAQRTTDPAIRADVLSTFGMVEFLMGRPPEAFMLEAEELYDRGAGSGQDPQTMMFTSARTCHGLQQLWAGDLAGAREALETELSQYEERGLYLFRDEVLCYLAELEARAGNWDLADRYAQEAYEIDVESGRLSAQGHILFPKALVGALRGDVDQARSDAEEGLRLSLLNEDLLDASCHRAVLGFLELSQSNPHAAIEYLKPPLEYLRALRAAEPGILPCVPDAIQALVAVGELDEAERLLNEHERKGRHRDRPWAIATAGRCRGLVLAARGEMPAALEALEVALGEHERLPQPFELARTLLVKGEVARRAKRKAMARESLEAARAIFDRLGARLWSAKAEVELARVGGPAGGGELTPTEQRIADLVVAGRTNKEIADALFISIKTVEANLSRVFHKLAVRSRTQLIASMMSSASAVKPQGSGPTA